MTKLVCSHSSTTRIEVSFRGLFQSSYKPEAIEMFEGHKFKQPLPGTIYYGKLYTAIIWQMMHYKIGRA